MVGEQWKLLSNFTYIILCPVQELNGLVENCFVYITVETVGAV